MWSEFESETIAGRFPLGKLVRSEGRYGWFETTFGGKPAILSLIESLNDEDDLLARLRAAQQVHHPNVVAILETGTASVRSTPLVYAVLEFTEENLEDVLRARALSAEETRPLAESLVQALAAIHKEKLTCGEIEASSVLAAGDIIKLRSDKLQKPASQAELPALTSKDVHSLGLLLYRCLTQKRPQLDTEDPSIELLPQPFSQIVRRAVGGQATVAEIDALLRQPVSALKAAESTAPASTRLPWEETSSTSSRPGHLPWMVAGLVLLVLVILFTLHAVLHSSKNASVQPAPAPVALKPVPAPVPVVKKPVAPVVKKSVAVVKPQPPAPTPQPATRPGTNAVWRVVAYTYNHQDQAEHKAQTVNSKYPGMNAEVFSPKGDRAPYLVTLGGPMERDAAFQLRNKAVQQGLPRDTYAQNYSH